MEDEGLLTENEELVEGEPGGRRHRRYISRQPIDAVRNFVDPSLPSRLQTFRSAIIACSSRGMPSTESINGSSFVRESLRSRRAPDRAAGTDDFLRLCVALHVPARSHHQNSAIARPSGAPSSNWNAHKQPFVWGRTRRHHTLHRPRIAAVPNAPTLFGGTPPLSTRFERPCAILQGLPSRSRRIRGMLVFARTACLFRPGNSSRAVLRL